MQLERIPPEERAQNFERGHQTGQLSYWVNPEIALPGFRWSSAILLQEY